jgi:hypothetical protein
VYCRKKALSLLRRKNEGSWVVFYKASTRARDCVPNN